MGVSLDLRKAHLSRQYGDITAIFSWINEERALFLIPSFRKGAPWFIVMEPAAHSWRDDNPANIQTAVAKGVKACDVLGIEPSPINVRRIVGIVNDSIADLVRMPSSPPVEYLTPSFGTMQLRGDGQELANRPILIEKQGTQYGG